MTRNYDNIIENFSKSSQSKYKKVNESEEKKLADEVERVVLEWFNKKKIEARESTSEEDVFSHADIVLNENITVDVKCKNDFYLELVTENGTPGWTYSGADIIIQTFKESEKWTSDEVYIYSKENMNRFINSNKWLFDKKYCMFRNGAVLWVLRRKTMEESMPFIYKIEDPELIQSLKEILWTTTHN